MIGVTAAALWSYWRRNPLQLLTMIAGLALATALWSGVQALNAEARASYAAAAAVVGEGRYDQLLPRVGDRIAQDSFVALRRAGWPVGPVLEGRLYLPEGEVLLLGIDPLTMPAETGAAAQAATVPFARFLSGDVVLAHPDDAASLASVVSADVIPNADITQGTALADIS